MIVILKINIHINVIQQLRFSVLEEKNYTYEIEGKIE